MVVYSLIISRFPVGIALRNRLYHIIHKNESPNLLIKIKFRGKLFS